MAGLHCYLLTGALRAKQQLPIGRKTFKTCSSFAKYYNTKKTPLIRKEDVNAIKIFLLLSMVNIMDLKSLKIIRKDDVSLTKELKRLSFIR